MRKMRISYLDEARGIAILLVVIGHCIGAIRYPINQAILCFYAKKIFINTKFLMLPICVSIVVVVSQINEPVLMYNNQYGNFGMFLMTSLCGSVRNTRLPNGMTS